MPLAARSPTLHDNRDRASVTKGHTNDKFTATRSGRQPRPASTMVLSKLMMAELHLLSALVASSSPRRA